MAETDVRALKWPALMARAQSGDRAAYNQLLKEMVPAIRGFVRKKIRDEALVEDVIQEALLAIHRVRHTYDPQRPILPWVAAIASARAIDALRQRGRRQEVQDEDALLHYPAVREGSDANGREEHEELTGYLGSLPPRQREMVEFVHLREQSLAQTAAESNLSVSAVKSLLHRAMLNLRQYGNGNREKS
ncbi:sigma-70 family RNA polymerase sigma factor [Rouxiella badensis]|jgi:RNA polymerase sigma-70 factor (ECF subfamily)|uniref:RNA polymerase subunit sigma-70 n=1 Tax=Rouxiella badensis TaxID=1646377 RepID=A0A1X0WAK3_9GAMM|nr:sigma-70 family RNA polymerase sigma factor [Rouxiella badensis]MCC3702954.1 sigma-70 family RNA polymerase sigma factor [Rouxiella badensis]MCC3720282.1 sigma-70 family RNA polymerase sigma factor [Rouxiella badensis]MCC3729945.1 sigma-70 family RNA polymerase sigma factor [Rouxiella badensis]MCC3733872.1 sigma-70 family RNA polymerase sigma factor [Rouxiella badensis]MCC3741432.1 sigma-70 family RNA polymerase sigma factor [Rouxiella badensis]